MRFIFFVKAVNISFIFWSNWIYSILLLSFEEICFRWVLIFSDQILIVFSLISILQVILKILRICEFLLLIQFACIFSRVVLLRLYICSLNRLFLNVYKLNTFSSRDLLLTEIVKFILFIIMTKSFVLKSTNIFLGSLVWNYFVKQSQMLIFMLFTEVIKSFNSLQSKVKLYWEFIETNRDSFKFTYLIYI
jgi:hypothetical protein